ncbi:MAG: HD domain-containing protein [Planctomycetota bacterium]
MIESTLAELARDIATKAHDGQFRRDGLTPYITHCESVAKRAGAGEDAIAVAWLHDVIEDTDVSAGDLKEAGIPVEVIDAVERLTKRSEIPYEKYLESVAESALATKVKIADMLTNLSDQPTKSQIRKYAKGLLFLTEDD